MGYGKREERVRGVNNFNKKKKNENKKKKKKKKYNTVQLKDRNNTFENIVFTRVYYFD